MPLRMGAGYSYLSPPRFVLSVQLITLGSFAVLQDGHEAPHLLTWKRRLSILLYLALEGEVTRDQLLALLWPETDLDRARHALSQALYEIRQGCGTACVESHGSHLRAGAEVEVDAALFQQRAESGEAREALLLYHGGFLESVGLAETVPFEHWVERTQSRLRRLHRRVRQQQIQTLLESGRTVEALAVAARWVEIEPFEDEAQHRLIQLLASTGGRAEAIRHFEAFEHSLHAEGLEPLEETRILIDRIRNQEEIGPFTPVPSLPLTRTRRQTPAGVRETPAHPGWESPGWPSSPAPFPATDRGLHRPQTTGQRPAPGEVAEPPLRLQHGPRSEPRVAPGTPPHPDRPWIADVADKLRDWWVFRATLALAGAIAVIMGVADALAVPPEVITRFALLSLAAMLILVPLIWATEPRLRVYLGFPPPRGWASALARGGSRWWKARWGVVAGGAAAALVVAAIFWPPAPPPPPEPLPEPLKLAVLPLLPTGTGGEDTAMADRLSEAIIGGLQGYTALDVPAWRRVAGYRSRVLSADSILEDLGVTYFLQGTAGIQGDTLFLDLDLEDRTSTEPIELSFEAVAGQLPDPEVITELLRRWLGALLEDKALRQETENGAAWDAFYRARQLASQVLSVSRSDPEGAEWIAFLADSLYQEAASADPGWATPLVRRATLARIRVSLGRVAELQGGRHPLADPARREEVGRAALQHLEEAMTRERGSEAPRVTLSEWLLAWPSLVSTPTKEERDSQVERAWQNLQIAASAYPPVPEASGRLAILYARDRRDYVQARLYGRRALQQDAWLDNLPDVTRYYARALFELGEDAEALDQCARAYRRGSSDPGTRWMLAQCQLQVLSLGNLPHPSPDTVWTLLNATLYDPDLERGGRPVPFNLQRARDLGWVYLAGTLSRRGESGEARRTLARAEHLPLDPWTAGVLALVGRGEEAVTVADSLAAQDRLGDPVGLLRSRAFDPLRGDPAFDSLGAAYARAAGAAGDSSRVRTGR